MKKVLLVFFAVLLCPSLLLAADKVELNTASLQQLDTLAGIGPALAQRIIDARPYYYLNDLMKVKGIGDKTLQKIKDQGLAYVEKPAPKAVKTPAAKPVAPAKNSVAAPEILPKPQKTDTTVTIAPVATAALSTAPASTDSNPWIMFIIAGGAAIISGAVFLAIKLILRKHDVRP